MFMIEDMFYKCVNFVCIFYVFLNWWFYLIMEIIISNVMMFNIDDGNMFI